METQSIMSQSIDPSLNVSMNQSLNDQMSLASSVIDNLKSERLGIPNTLIIDGFFYIFNLFCSHCYSKFTKIFHVPR